MIVTRYYARRLAPRVDIRIVLVALVTIVSALQYYVAWFNFEAAISHLATVPKYRLQVKNKEYTSKYVNSFFQALEVARERMPDLGGKTRAGKEREVAKAREEAAVREVGVVKMMRVMEFLMIMMSRSEKLSKKWLPCCEVDYDD